MARPWSSTRKSHCESRNGSCLWPDADTRGDRIAGTAARLFATAGSFIDLFFGRIAGRVDGTASFFRCRVFGRARGGIHSGLGRVCRLFIEADGALEPDALADIPGVGPWTLDMIALRGTGDPDVLPAGDLGLENGWRLGRPGASGLADHAAAHWRPWRSYAANLLWRSLTP